MEVCLEISVEKTKYTFAISSLESGHKNSKQIVRKYVKVEIFGEDSKKSKSDSKEIKRRPNCDNACYHSAQDILYSGFLSKNIKKLENTRL
jgi:hypothetical protein